MLETPNAGGTSQLSEALSLEFLARSPSPFVSKSGVFFTFCLKKWRLLHLLS